MTPPVTRPTAAPVTAPTAAAPAAAPSAGGRSAATRGDADDPKLRNAARQLEGVFTQQLFKAMRETVPQGQGEISDSGGAQDMFTGLLDERLANDPRASSTHGIGDAIYHHLLRARGAHHADAATGPAGTPAAGVTLSPSGASLRKSR
ncbi:MAG TPA: rod-binding protein [Gemmatirosa sp.]